MFDWQTPLSIRLPAILICGPSAAQQGNQQYGGLYPGPVPLPARRRTEYVETGVELIYFILEGEMTVRTKDETIVLKKYDSIHFNVGDGKEIRNETNLPASMLVIAGMPGRG